MDVGTAFAAISVNMDLITINNLSLAYVLIEHLLYNGTDFKVEVMFHKGKSQVS